jgi:hypothetical protein
VDPARAGDPRLRLRRRAVRPGRPPRAACPSPGDDDAHRARDRRRVRVQRHRDAGLSGDAAVGRALHARHGDAARSLDRDALHHPGARGAEGAREAPPVHGRPGRRRPRGGGPALRAPRRRHDPRPPGIAPSRRWSRGVRREHRRRVHDHRRVAPSEEAPGRAGDRGHRERCGLAARPGDRDRREDRARRDHAARRARADVPIARAGLGGRSPRSRRRSLRRSRGGSRVRPGRSSWRGS